MLPDSKMASYPACGYNFGISIFISIFIGMLITGIIVNVFPSKVHEMAMKAIEECELNIPRNQNCKIIAVINGE